MTISLVIPVRNGAAYLTECAAHLRNQRRPADEVVVVADPTSTDSTVAVARSLAIEEGWQVILQTGRGVASAINEGILASSGELIGFASADDHLAPNALAAHERALGSDVESGYSVGLVTYFIDPTTGPPPGWRPELLDGPRRARMIETTVIRRATFELVGLHRVEAGASSDVDWFARAHDTGVAYVEVDEVVVHKRAHAASTAHTSTTGTTDLLAVARDAIRRKRAGS